MQPAKIGSRKLAGLDGGTHRAVEHQYPLRQHVI
jgi:hypothetical protein